MENSSKKIRAKRREGKDEMQNNGLDECPAGEDNNSSLSQTKKRAVLEEQLYWARLEKQKCLALSAEADETIWNLAALARRTMQERDEARMILANFQARNAQTTMLQTFSGAAARAGVFAATGNSQALAPTTTLFRPSMVMQRHDARTVTGYCMPSSSNFGHMNFAYSVDPPPLHGFTSLLQEPFDPDMFLVDAVDSPQDAVLATAGSSGLEKNSRA